MEKKANEKFFGSNFYISFCFTAVKMVKIVTSRTFSHFLRSLFAVPITLYQLKPYFAFLADFICQYPSAALHGKPESELFIFCINYSPFVAKSANIN